MRHDYANQYECTECGELYMDWPDTNTGLCHNCAGLYEGTRYRIEYRYGYVEERTINTNEGLVALHKEAVEQHFTYTLI